MGRRFQFHLPEFAAGRLVDRADDLRRDAFDLGVVPEAVRLLKDLEAPLSRLVEAPIGLDQVPEAYERLIAGAGGKLKQIVRP